MRKILYVTIPVLAWLAACSPKVIYTGNPPPQSPPDQPVYSNNPPPQQPADQYPADQQQTDQVFYDELSPYGTWIDYPNEGYVWQPNVDPDFRPYDTNGSWVYSDYGWTWSSNYSWGWAPFHYGNWFYDDNYGWLWEPGRQWAPAWVTWGQSGGYYGWAPLPPRTDPNSNWTPRNDDWNFVPASHITTVNVNRYVVRNNVTVIHNTTIINNVTNNTTVNNYSTNNVTNTHATNIYNRGPKVEEVENITNTRINKVNINQSTRPGESLANGQLSIYRPAIRQAPQQSAVKPAPRQVVSYNRNNTGPARQSQIPANGQTTRTEQNGPQGVQNQGRQPYRVSTPVTQQNPTAPQTEGQGREALRQNEPANGQNPGNQNNSIQRQQPQKQPGNSNYNNQQNPGAGQNANKPVVKPQPSPQQNGYQPARQNQNPAVNPGNNPNTRQQNPNNPNRNGKPDTSKRHVKQQPPPQPAQRQNN